MKRTSPSTFTQAATALNDTLVTTVDAELMTNYLPNMPVSPGHSIQAGQDLNGEPMVFSIGTDDQLYLVCRDTDSSSGWQQLNLSSGLGSDFQAQAFGLGQAVDGSLVLALSGVLSASPDNVQVYITGYLPNDAAASVWDDFGSQWIARTPPSTDTNALVTRFLIGDDFGGNTAPMILALTDQDGDLEHYFINGDPTDTSWTWKPYPMPNNAEQLLSVAIGKTSYGPGTFALYSTGGVLNLVFTSIPNQYDSTYNVPLTAPAGATVLQAIPDPDNSNYSKLFVGGQGLHWFNSHNLSRDAVAEEILSPDQFPSLFELLVRQDEGTMAIWFNDKQEDLFYLFGDQAGGNLVGDWSIPLLLREQTTQIAALRNQERQTNEVFFVGGDSTLGYLRQDPLSTLWREIDIPLEDTGSVQEIQCYTTSVHFSDANGNPLINLPVQANASEWTYVQVNGNMYVLDDDTDHPVTVTTDGSGYLTLINQVSDISTPVFTFSHEKMDGNLIANPATKVTEGLGAIQSGDDLKNATNLLGQPVISGSYSDEVYDYGAFSIQQLSAALAQLPADGSEQDPTASTADAKMAYVPQAPSHVQLESLWGMSFEGKSPKLYKGDEVREILAPMWGVNVPAAKSTTELGVVSWVEGVFGNVMQALENAAEEVFGFFVQVAEDVFQFLVKIGETVFKIIIKMAAQALKIANWILEFLFGISLQDIIKWLGFLFSWGDIVTTHQVFANLANQTLNLFQSDTQNAVVSIERFFDTLKAKVAGLSPLPADVAAVNVKSTAGTGISDTNSTGQQMQQFAANSVAGNFSNYQLVHSGAVDYDDPTEGSGSGPIVTFVTEVVVPALTDIYDLVGDVVKDMMLLFEDGSLTIGQVVEKLLTDVAVDLIQILEDLLVGMIETGAAVAELFQSTITAPINIPFLTAFYKLVAGGDDMTLLDGLCLLAAIPATIGYKLVAGEAPFADSTYGLDTDGYQQLFQTLSGNSSSATSLARVMQPTLTLAAEDDDDYSTAQKVYSQVGGVCYTLTSWLSGGLDIVESLSEGEVKFASELGLVSSLVGVASAFPIEQDDLQRDLDYGAWAFDIMGLLIGFCVYLTPRAAKPEAEMIIEGPFEILEAIVDLVLYTVSFIAELEEDGDEWGWDAEKYVQNLLACLSKAASGVSKIDPDPVDKAVEQAVAGGTLVISGILNLTRITESIEQDLVHQNF